MTTYSDIHLAVIQSRVSAWFAIRITFNDGAPDFAGHYRSAAERDAKIAAARRMPNVARVTIIESL